MTHYPNTHGARSPHEARRVDTARAAFVQLRGELDAAKRQREIESLPSHLWKGRTLRTIRCHGTSGKGQHDVNVPESMLWALIGFEGFCCVYHAGERQSADRKEP